MTWCFAVALSLLTVVPALAQDQPRMGGVLKIATIGEPPTLDLHTTTAVITQQIMWHVFESLFTYDQAFSPMHPDFLRTIKDNKVLPPPYTYIESRTLKPLYGGHRSVVNVVSS